MNQFNEIRRDITQAIRHSYQHLDYIKSVTIVGSFVTSNDISSISDIDVVVILDELTREKYDEVLSRVNQLDVNDLGLNGYELKINPTFGPLKLNSDKVIVFHVMVYDIQGHVVHVNESAFTCYGWEAYNPIIGLSLREIYPVGSLQFDDIIESRRGLKTYLDDIEKGAITYRNYEFDERGNVKTIKLSYSLDERHQKEYAYHILKHLLGNFLKIYHQKNGSFGDDQLIESFQEIDQGLNDYLEFYKQLALWKKSNGKEPNDVLATTKRFIQVFFEWVEDFTKSLPEVDVLRHGKTSLNDGSFLGVGRDPGLLPLENQDIKPGETKYAAGFSSALLRAKESLNLFDCVDCSEVALINEINYGEAEGLTIGSLSKQYPEIIEEWSGLGDPRFPKGENQQDVLTRLQQFVRAYLTPSKKTPIIVVSHLVVLRMLLKWNWNIAMHDCYKIQIKHLESLQYHLVNNLLVPRFSGELRVRLRTQIANTETNKSI